MAMRAILYDAAGRDQEVVLDERTLDGVGDEQLLWVDVDSRDDRDVAALAAALDLPPEVVEDLREPSRTAMARRYRGAIHLTLHAVGDPGSTSQETRQDARRQAHGAGPIEVRPIDVWIGENLVVTVHEGRAEAFEAFDDSVRDASRLGALTAADLTGALIDSVLGFYLRHVEALERRVDALDELAMQRRQSKRFLAEVVAIRRRVTELRRALAPHRQAMGPLARADFEIEELGRTWPGLLERLEVTLAAIENVRELLVGTIDIYLSGQSDQTNRVMQRLAVLNAALLPSIVLAGLMGMNFKIAFFDEPTNFFLVVAAMVVIAVGSLVLARRWI
jgi:Mg2+ and Co2+ transporter CorA